ncbi:MAG: FAD-dependent monooxygenase [Actinomycetota bacterium]|nr:FAD-dependent monooxygenase [Actinomycetota bacterium]
MNEFRLDHAVVIGGSMAGVLTAQALSERFDRVTVIERDRLPEGPMIRKGVPQERHVHAFWAGGMRILESLLPGVRESLLDAGAVPLAMPTDTAWMTPAGRWTQRFPATQSVVSASRPLLEWAVRNQVCKTPSIRFLEEHEVTALRQGTDGDIVGVDLRDRSTGTRLHLSAQLVVDASGRRSKLPDWLAALGLSVPRETVIDASLGYATRVYDVPDRLETRWKAVYIQSAAPEHPRGGIMFPIEGHRWVLTLIGTGGDHPPTDEDGFLKFAASLRHRLLADAIGAAEPASPIWGFRRTENRWRHYEKLSMPAGLLAIGDSLCAFNPVYGQGMTVAAKEVEALRRVLQECRSSSDLPRVTRAAQKAIASRVKGPWMIATGNDLRSPNTVGASQTPIDRLVNKYLDRILAAVADDPVVNAAFLRVLNLIDEPTALFAPRLAARVLRRRRFKDATQPDPVRVLSPTGSLSRKEPA